MASVVCLLLAATLVPLSVAGWWLRDTVSDPDTYLDTVGPLADDPDVQDAVARRLSDAAMARVDDSDLLVRAADGLEERGVPPALAQALTLLAEPLRDAVEERVDRATTRLVRSPAFAEAWRSANSSAHENLIAVLEDESDLVDIAADDTVSIRLATLVDSLQQALVDAGVPGADRLDPVDAAIPIGSVEELSTLRTGYGLLLRWSVVLPVLALLLGAVGVLLARRRRRALVAVCSGAVLAALAVLLVLAVLRGQLVGALPPEGSPAAAEALYDGLTDRLRQFLRLTVLALVLVAAVALLSSPAPGAVRWRGRVATQVGRGTQRLRGRGRTVLVGVAALSVALVLFLPDPGVLTLVALVLAACLSAGLALLAPSDPSAEQPPP